MAVAMVVVVVVIIPSRWRGHIDGSKIGRRAQHRAGDATARQHERAFGLAAHTSRLAVIVDEIWRQLVPYFGCTGGQRGAQAAQGGGKSNSLRFHGLSSLDMGSLVGWDGRTGGRSMNRASRPCREAIAPPAAGPRTSSAVAQASAVMQVSARTVTAAGPSESGA